MPPLEKPEQTPERRDRPRWWFVVAWTLVPVAVSVALWFVAPAARSSVIWALASRIAGG